MALDTEPTTTKKYLQISYRKGKSLEDILVKAKLNSLALDT